MDIDRSSKPNFIFSTKITQRLRYRCSLDIYIYLRLSPVDFPASSCRRESMATDPSFNVRSNEIIALDNGRLCVYDVEELQIRAIIEMENRRSDVTALGAPLVGVGSPLRFRVKRSLQRFLEKRKKRGQALAPFCSSSTSSPNF
ncbi:PREDICTED: protein JAZ13-like isoform X2 [Tarenaya hassleriana]|uniref:protein JAZ13-like isoform X2 n=1 Tax=Tarenaya hassleriana TaxID=28532 RepID=UPI00053C57FD|nr:PREDICTED: protein JAZ13-like isoform X2 [Tarenaya hassleriana]